MNVQSNGKRITDCMYRVLFVQFMHSLGNKYLTKEVLVYVDLGKIT
jgi:hypothetical protein